MTFAHPFLEADFKARSVVLANGQAEEALARLIDSTLLKVDATENDILAVCRDAKKYAFRAVCVAPHWVPMVKRFFETELVKNVNVCTVIGFPNGYSSTATKTKETEFAVADGAHEIDFVQNIGWIKDGKWQSLHRECEEIVLAAQGALVKIILETSILSEVEIARCTEVAAMAGVHVIKTSTGFGQRGASLGDIQLMAKTLDTVQSQSGLQIGIKASGGVRSRDDALKMIRAGATRIGTSGGVAIVQGLANKSNY